MNPNMIEQYLQSLKAMGLTDEAIAMYRQQMEQQINLTTQWASQMGQSGMDLQQQFANMFNAGQEADEGEVQLNPDSKLTQAEQWAVACGADLAQRNGQYLNDLTTGFSKQECRDM